MATRFYIYPSSGSPPAPVSPAFDVNWGLTASAARAALVRKNLNSIGVSNNPTVNIPITTTQNILSRQFVSEPLRAQTITGTVSFVARCIQSSTSCNATLSFVANLFSQDGGTLRGNLFTASSTDTAMVAATAATRIVNAQTVTSQTAQAGDRIVVEIGYHAAAPSVSGTGNMLFTTNQTTDYALTSGLTTTLNSWVEFSQDLFLPVSNNYQFVSNSNGDNAAILAFGEKLR